VTPRRPWSSRLLPALLFVALAAPAALGLPRLADALRADGRWWLAAVEWVPVAAPGQPLLVFVDARCEGCGDPLLQLRVCRDDGGACDLAARRAPDAAGVTRLRYGRPLPPGRYGVEVLFLQRDGWGALRTTLRTEGWVDVR
jgi:hypothetical protein